MNKSYGTTKKEKVESILRAGNFKNMKMFCHWLKRYDPMSHSEAEFI